MSPITVEMILFLKKQKDLWDISDVHYANEKRKEANREGRTIERTKEHNEIMRILRDLIEEALGGDGKVE